NGESTTGHFGLYRLVDLGDSSRVAYYRLEGTLNPGGTLAGCDGHGALNGHIIGNYDNFTGFQHQAADGYSYGIGICPFVKLGSSVIFDNSVPDDDYTFPDFNTLASDAYGSGARISSDSWGVDVGGAYDFEAQTYDKLVRDAQSGVDGNQEMSFVFAAGNAGPCGGTKPLGIDSPGSAKNVITVGAAANVRSLSITNGGNDPSGNDACGVTDADASSADNIDCASSRGPCRDGRMKPDLVAPGTHITGGVPQDTSRPQPLGLGSAISCFNALGVCALPNSGTTDNTNNFFPLGQQFYTVSSGTSHSTPVVAGACALVRQFFINNSFTAPSPAMTKAFLMNSARYLTGVSANDTLWSPSQGMGEVNLGTAFDGVPRFLRDQTPDDMFTATGQRRAYVGQVADPSQPFRVTVAWTDAPGNTSGAAYNNNLDLTVIIGGKTYKGNVFSGQFSVTGGKADKKNNVESVFLPAGTTGNFTVIVTAANINSDGVPGSSSSLSQDFAAVIYNGNAAEVPTYTPMAASYNGLFFEAGGAEVGRSGAITITTTTASSYSGKLQIGSSSVPFSGTLDVTGAATNAITPKGGQPLGISLKVDLDDESIINGTVTSPGVWSATLLANSAPAKTASLPFAGNYTLIFPGTNDNPQLPAGDGYATATVSAGGKVKLTGSLADGTKLSQSSVVAANGQWPFYVSLYGGQGQILGWLLVTNSGSENAGGDVNWIKPASETSKFYPGGFNFTTHATGSLFDSSVPISFVNGEILLSGGDLADAILNPVTVSGSSATGANKLSLKLSATGAFKGSVPNPPGKPIPINGVFLQSRQFGSGYFLGTDQSSRVFFGPAE
ncbi:MAG TPA: S8 family serine peptidase, partial [Candidatus Polarisedimenticolia bacterium]|nr:S8 family serine peptidase [Candidatus Polarisedimenticolia bacterium]